MPSDALRSRTNCSLRWTQIASTGRTIAVTILLSTPLGFAPAPDFALAAGAFGTPQCVTVVDTTIGMVGVMPPGSLDRNDTTLFPIGSAEKVPPVKVGDLVEVEPARNGGAMTPTFRVLEAAAAKCSEIAKASDAERAHHAGHEHHEHGDPATAPDTSPAPATAP